MLALPVGMVAGVEDHPPGLRDYAAALNRRKWLVLGVAAAVATLAALSSARAGPAHTALARLVVRAFPPNTPGQPTTVNVETEARVVASAPVAARVVRDTGVDVDELGLLGALEVSAIPLTEVIEVRYTSSDSAEAALLADSFARSYLEHRRSQVAEDLGRVQEALTGRVGALRGTLEEVEGDMQGAAARGERDLVRTLEVERDILVIRLGSLQEALSAAEQQLALIGGGADTTGLGGEVIAPARVDAGEAGAAEDIALGAALGLFLGAGIALLLEVLSRPLASRGPDHEPEATSPSDR
ncbi:MAG: hypothetical protein LC798_20070 [Chloroflexi bacterium]|nr:hypothetical protein [Chloroflexota bacterium]